MPEAGAAVTPLPAAGAVAAGVLCLRNERGLCNCRAAAGSQLLASCSPLRGTLAQESRRREEKAGEVGSASLVVVVLGCGAGCSARGELAQPATGQGRGARGLQGSPWKTFSRL